VAAGAAVVAVGAAVVEVGAVVVVVVEAELPLDAGVPLPSFVMGTHCSAVDTRGTR
jgi:hypothetical protein